MRIDCSELSHPHWKFANAHQTGYKVGELKLESNIGEISSSMLRWLVPLPATASDDEIRREYETKGVVHIKGVIPRKTVLAMRAK